MMCNFIFQNIIFIILIFLYIYFVLDFRFRKTDFDYKRSVRKRRKESALEWFANINGWQAAISALIFTIVYFFLKRGVLTDILSVFGIKIC